MPEALSTRAIVLRAVAYGESDRVVTLLGRSTGRLSAIARGARKSQRRFGGGLGLGTTGEVSVRERGTAELLVMESFEVENARLELAGDLGRTAHAGYAVELCDRLCGARQPEPEVFDWLETFLDLLASRGAGVERLRAFELGLLGRLGLGPGFGACVACGRNFETGEAARLQPDRGGAVCSSCGRSGTPLSGREREALGRLGSVALPDAEQVPLERDLNAACRRAIFELLGPHVGAPLKSLTFIEKMSAG